MKIAILSNVNLDLLVQQVSKGHEVFEAPGYGQWVGYAATVDEGLASFDPKIIFLLLDGTALLESAGDYGSGIAEIGSALGYAKALAGNYPAAAVAISTIDIRRRGVRPNVLDGEESLWEAEWERGLNELVFNTPNAFRFDLKKLITRFGRDAFCSDKMWYMGSIPYSMKGTRALAAEMETFIDRREAARKKVLVLDMDNTLYGGVIGEDGPDGITLSESLIGAAYRDAQKRMKEIAETGILLAIVSKNNEEDALLAFENRHMVLKPDDFVSIKANWDSKAQNIAALAEELNLSLDSFVFLDDNPVEREEVRMRLSEVEVADFPDDIALLPATVERIYTNHFYCWRQTAEDSAKTEQYRQEAKRASDRKAAGSMDEYLQSLEIIIGLGEASDAQVDRTIQLLNKTNQFNTNTVRMDMQEFLRFREKEGNRIYVATVSDRYGDSGLVVILMVEVRGAEAVVANFVMSCRVMGRQIENAVMDAVMQVLASEGVRVVHASYKKSLKNKPVEELFDRLGFDLLQADEAGRRYSCALPAKSSTILKAKWVG